MGAVGTFKNELSWSRTRAGVFGECRRKYWFQYYGHWGGWQPNAAERTHATWVLKQLKTRWMWAGDLVHRAVEDVLETMRAGGKCEPDERAERAVALMRTEFDQSRKKKYWQHPKRYCGLLEHEYENPVTDDEWGEVADHVRACVKAFFASPFPERLASIPSREWLPVEKLDSFRLDGVKIWVKPDCAYRTGSGATIVDWKTGRRDKGGDPVQLACYTIYALEKKWAGEPEEVTTIEYNLARSKAREETMTAARVEETRETIREGVADMRPLDGKPEDAFPVTENPKICRSCSFRKICPDKPLK